MTRHPASRRLHQQKEPDDIVTEKLLQFLLWAKRNVRQLGIGAAVIAIAVLATIYSVNMREARRAESLVRLNEVRQTALSGNHALALRDLDSFIERFSGTQAADEARIILAQISLDEGEPARALEALAPLARKLSAPLGTPAAILLATAYEESGEEALAVETLMRVADGAPMGYQRREAINQAARISENQGETERAIELYQRLIGLTDEGSPERALAEMRLAEAKARTRV